MQISSQQEKMIHLIARVFEYEADESLVSSVHAYLDNPLEDLHPEAQRLAENAHSQLHKALDVLEKTDNRSDWFDYLAAAYAELFLGVAEIPIAPFESVYLGREKTLYERQYFEVIALMTRAEYTKPRSFHESEDHLALEWHFLGYLLEKASEKQEEGSTERAYELNKIADQFFAEHLNLWSDTACDDLMRNDDSNGFYSGFALLAKAILVECRIQKD